MTTANIDLGKIRFKWRGTWDSATAYTRDDCVQYAGQAFVCVVDDQSNSTNVTPLVGSNDWELMAAGGDPTTTMTTAGDLLVRGSGGLERLGVGAEGQALVSRSGSPAWGSPGVTGNVIQRYYNRYIGRWTIPTSYTWFVGLNTSFTPVSATSTIRCYFNFYINKYDTSGFITHIKFWRGAEISRYPASNHTSGYGEHNFTIYEEIPSWGTTADTVGLYGSAYSSSYQGILHSAGWWDGTGSAQSIPGIMIIEEVE